MNESLLSSADKPQSDTVDEPDMAQPLVCLPFQQSIYLVGMMGAGKTTIGRALARRLGWEFVDLDHELESRCGVLLDEYTRQPGIVLATGGGAVLAAENRQHLHERGVVVYLRANADELFRRVARDRNRPLLQTDNPRQRLKELLEQREPLYDEVAHLAFDTGSLPITQTTRILLQRLQDYTASPAHQDSEQSD